MTCSFTRIVDFLSEFLFIEDKAMSNCYSDCVFRLSNYESLEEPSSILFSIYML